MLFNSVDFLLFFLPICLFVSWYVQKRFGRVWLLLSIFLFSLFFYGYFYAPFVFILLGSVSINAVIGRALLAATRHRTRIRILTSGVGINLLVLGYFKYTNFAFENLGYLFDIHYQVDAIALPLGISFFTFQQIAFLVDTSRRQVPDFHYPEYGVFICFFPQLIAGPIVHHSELIPQLRRETHFTRWSRDFAVGITIFAIGLAKKVLIADTLSQYATPVFQAAELGTALTLWESWGGAVAYSLQLYFDFSAYSDMAIGLARMFGYRLPANFNSPYKASSIIDFWHRWHITLSRFLRHYLYISLGGNRLGRCRQYTNILVTMALGGLWHGASWNFVVWGLIHGIMVAWNHVWRHLVHRYPVRLPLGRRLPQLFMFVIIVITWVPFRAETMSGAGNVFSAMIGMNGISLPASTQAPLVAFMPLFELLNITFDGAFRNNLAPFSNEGFWILAGVAIVLFAPNTQEIMGRYRPVFEPLRTATAWFQWRPTAFWAFFTYILLFMCVSQLGKPSEFLYFQF